MAHNKTFLSQSFLSSRPFTVRFFIWALAWSWSAALIGCFVYNSTFSPSSPLYHNMWLRTVLVDMALLLTGLLITSGLVAFAEWHPEGGKLSNEAEVVKNEIEALERERREKSLLQELKARRDSLREEVKAH